MSMLTSIVAALVVLAPPTYDPAKTMFTINSEALNEASGIAVSPSQQNLVYLHNDSGDKPRFFSYSWNGGLYDETTLNKANAIDWEDMASAKVGKDHFLYFGDIGDNAAIRKNIQIYRVPEANAPNSLSTYHRYDFIYPDRAHNCEALMVEPGSGNIWLVTKEENQPAQVFTAKAPFKTTEVNRLVYRGEIKFAEVGPYSNLVTGGDISPNGKHLVLRTYWKAYEFDLPKGMNKWWTKAPREVTLPIQKQGEAICYTSDNDHFLICSEGTPTPVLQITIHRN